MCMGIPMQVLAVEPGWARVSGRGETQRVDTALVGEVRVGDWLLIFIDGAREAITAERAAEVNATLDLVAAAMCGSGCCGQTAASFDLPSAMSADDLAALTGARPS